MGVDDETGAASIEIDKVRASESGHAFHEAWAAHDEAKLCQQASHGEFEWHIHARDGMRVPGIIFGDRRLIQGMDDKVLEQIRNVARLPGIVGASYAMPDAHWGYGFPIGGVAAFDARAGGVISAGGVGFDISCGVRTLLTGLTRERVEPLKVRLADTLFAHIPAGVGSTGAMRLSASKMDDMLTGGAAWAVDQGYGNRDDLQRIEGNGRILHAKPGAVSDLAKTPTRRDGHAQVRQSLSRGAGNCGDLRTSDRGRIRPSPGAGRRDDPLRLARTRASDRHRVSP